MSLCRIKAYIHASNRRGVIPTCSLCGAIFALPCAPSRQSPGVAAIAILSLALGIGANVTVYSVVREMIVDDLSAQRAGFLAALSGLGMILALIGLYGSVSYATTRRTREMGIRSAPRASESSGQRPGMESQCSSAAH